MEKSSKLEKKKKVWYLFLRVFEMLLSKSIFLTEAGHEAMCPPKFKIFIIFPNFLRSQVLVGR